MNAQEAAKAVKEKFGSVVQAINPAQEMTMLVVPKFSDGEDEGLEASLWASDLKDFYVEVDDIENTESDRWIIRSKQGTWILQKPPVEKIATDFAKQMKKAGISA